MRSMSASSDIFARPPFAGITQIRSRVEAGSPPLSRPAAAPLDAASLAPGPSDGRDVGHMQGNFRSPRRRANWPVRRCQLADAPLANWHAPSDAGVGWARWPERGPRTARCSRRRAQATRARSPSWSSRTGPSCTPTATACSARPTTPRTRCRTRCCGPGAASAVWRPSARGPGSTRSPPTSASTHARGGGGGCCRWTTGPPADPAAAPGEPLPAAVWVEPYPDERVGVGRGPRLAGGVLRAARVGRARVRRGPPAPAAARPRRADPARGAGLLGAGDGRGARRDAGVGEQRPAARAARPRGAPAGAQPAGDAARAGRRGRPRAGGALHRRVRARRR